MDDIRVELIISALIKANALIDPNIYDNLEKQYEFRNQTILADKSLTKDEKSFTINELNIGFDSDKVLFNEGMKRNCEICKEECLAISYCEHCIRNYLKGKFSNWTSKNDDIDNLIQNCQMETYVPNMVIEWIPYKNLQNIEYLTKGGCSEIYTADWINGFFIEWDSKEQQLKRFGRQKVILKRLEN